MKECGAYVTDGQVHETYKKYYSWKEKAYE